MLESEREEKIDKLMRLWQIDNRHVSSCACRASYLYRADVLFEEIKKEEKIKKVGLKRAFCRG
jgi:hypothetical protein